MKSLVHTLSRWWLLCSWLLLLFPIQQVVPANEMTCEADGTCTTDGKFLVEILNKSPFRADVHWDDGGFGQFLVTVEAKGGKAQINARENDVFFVTRHGVKEGLFDLQTDTPYKFRANPSSPSFIIPQLAAPSNNPCQDRFSACDHYAKMGSCFDNPGWMIVHCCKSCDSYIDAAKLVNPKVRCTKENLNITEPAWHPGDLNRLFASWATDPSFAKYEPQILSSPDPDTYGGAEGPWVLTFDNFLTDEEADALIRGGQMVGFDRSTDQGSVNSLGEMEKVVSHSRTSSNAWCNGACEALPEVQAITGKIEQVTGVPRTNYESFQILEYGHDQYYRMHHDSTNRDETPSGPRIMTFFLYLTDVEEGGETKFNQLDIAVKPKRGRALVWPSVRDENPAYWDARMYHEAMPVIRGTKYAANHWIHLNDYMGPNKWGCTGSFSWRRVL